MPLFYLVIVMLSVIVSVVLVVILMIPVTLVQLPALALMVVVRMVPIRALVGRAVPASRHPPVVAAVWSPIAFDPGIARTRFRTAFFVAQGWWCGADVDSDLCRRRDTQSGCEQ
jgi:hypothetical protein